MRHRVLFSDSVFHFLRAGGYMSCSKCGGITGYTYFQGGRVQANRWGIPYKPEYKHVRCRDCERKVKGAG